MRRPRESRGPDQALPRRSGLTGSDTYGGDPRIGVLGTGRRMPPRPSYGPADQPRGPHLGGAQTQLSGGEPVQRRATGVSPGRGFGRSRSAARTPGRPPALSASVPFPTKSQWRNYTAVGLTSRGSSSAALRSRHEEVAANLGADQAGVPGSRSRPTHRLGRLMSVSRSGLPTRWYDLGRDDSERRRGDSEEDPPIAGSLLATGRLRRLAGRRRPGADSYGACWRASPRPERCLLARNFHPAWDGSSAPAPAHRGAHPRAGHGPGQRECSARPWPLNAGATRRSGRRRQKGTSRRARYPLCQSWGKHEAPRRAAPANGGRAPRSTA